MPPRAQFRDTVLLRAQSGLVTVPPPNADALVSIYDVGTSTPVADVLYADDSSSSTLTNPMPLGQDGRVEFWTLLERELDIVVTCTGYLTLRTTTTTDSASVAEIGPQGPPGATGPAGATGPQGIAGPTGPQGPAGLGLNIKGTVANQAALPSTGNTVNDAYVTVDTGHLWAWNGSAWIDCGLTRGPAGPTGPQGIQGIQGQTGLQGATGADGAVGQTGPQGPQGASGPQGLQGAEGPLGPAGPQGPAGLGLNIKGTVATQAALPATGNTTNDAWVTNDTGHVWVWNGTTWVDAGLARGPAGPTGPQGDQGIAGPSGAQGTPGTQGATGPPGADGPSGAQGIPGTQGPPGAPGSTGPQGDPGLQGVPGPTGPTGPSGIGIPTGGAAGMVLEKSSSTDYATQWGQVTNAALASDTARANLLTNGGFEIWQRGNGPFNANAVYGPDRWQLYIPGTDALSVSMATGGADAGSYRCASFTYTLGSGGGSQLYQQIKTADNVRLAGKTLSYSARVLASVANSIRIGLQTDGTGGVTTQSPAHSGSGAWETLSVTVVVPTDATNIQAKVFFLATGNPAVDNGMLVVGSQPADYAPLHPADDLARCLRYYEPSYITSSTGYGTTGNNYWVAHGFCARKCVTPTLTKVGTWSISGMSAQPTTGFGTVDGFSLNFASNATGNWQFWASSLGSDGVLAEANP